MSASSSLTWRNTAITLAVLALMAVMTVSASAQETTSESAAETVTETTATASDQPSGDATAEQDQEKKAEVDVGELTEQIDDLKGNVTTKKKDLDAINSRIRQYESLAMQKNAEAASLADDVALIDNRIAKEQLEIDITKQEIQSVELEIELLDRQIGDKEEQLTRQRELLGALARKLYRAQAHRSLLELLLAHRTFSEFFNELHALTRLQLTVDDAVEQVKSLRSGLEQDKSNRETRRMEAMEQKRKLEVAKLDLEDQRFLKQEMLMETKSSELEYRYLLVDLKREQSDADSEIMYLEKVMREKKDLATRLAGEKAILSWPVVPTRGLSSVFHDPDYPFRYIFEHPAVDIRAYQGTPVRAAAAGIVARAKNAGMGYSYVMLMHSGTLSTVYGHLTRITAKEDSFVERGEIIGYSGGMPGTAGAGRMTTGPHLHFEVRLDGLPVDPLKYLVSDTALGG
ncbi:MAG: peptidoglycan DD-metalloendopeptidase family protein [Patescibacteria group bacterium]|nr:peptidoglycan DD-metalloendopeptidase family protein [Patescibacteria group bacterium]